MKRICCLLAFGLITAFAQQNADGAARDTFSRSAYLTHIDYLAGDALDGRGLGTEGIERAAKYFAEQFKACGLEPAGDKDTYFQSFEVKLSPEQTDTGYFRVDGADIKAESGEDYVPFNFSSDAKFSGDVVFGGYGIVNEDKEHDDFVHLDVEGKVVLMLRREPPSWGDGDGERDFTPHAQFSNKIYNAKDRGAVAVLIANQRPAEGDEDHLTSWIGMGGGGGDYGLPALHVTRALADKLLAAGGLDSLDALQTKLDDGGYASKALSGVKLSADPGIKRKTATTRNVIGMLRAKGPLADEFVVIGGHYDHLGRTIPRRGFGMSDTTEQPELQIHNGADDNASGSAGVIELAKALSRAGDLKRSVLFIAFSAEETGLLGSKHFVEHPTIPLDHIVAMLNMDMIGRLPDESDAKVQVFGTKAAEEFEDMIERLGAQDGLDIQGSASAIGPSDHTSFYRKKIPALHFFTGLHGDYHRPGDDTDKINADGAIAVLNLVYDVALEIANKDAKPTYHEVTERARIPGRGGFRVRMGIYPSYADNTDGMAVDGVVDDGPAAEAGMKSGDVIIKIGETDVANIRDYMGALRNNKPGDEVDVIIKRGEENLTLNVKLIGS